ncbi:hypothetical protein Nepgr_029607 [Nepenthes gracilis]|uniref:Peptidase S59 domain-containing protein n=1 Tax=Nepenthes gracilis TaxID=150966 RepID=A0AAD3Y588_NEPGR|nr:hypothetical protein Nepgr_029607 [Nepenthes gracilis]
MLRKHKAIQSHLILYFHGRTPDQFSLIPLNGQLGAMEDKTSSLKNKSTLVNATHNLAENKAGEEKIKLLRPYSRDHPSCAVHADDRAPIVSRKIVSKQESAVNEHEIKCQAPLPKFKRLGYLTEPTISELAAMEMSKPDSLRHVKDFVVGCHGYGHVTFEGIMVEKYSDMLKKVAEKQGDGFDCIFCETVKGD